MAVSTLRQVLVDSGAVTALVPAERIEALRRTQSFDIPAITLTESKTPFVGLRGNTGLDSILVTIDIYGNDYTEALEISIAVRTALEADPRCFTMEPSPPDNSEPETNPELFLITQTWLTFS